MILILTNKLDIAADWVVRELRSRKADFLRLNTEDWPTDQVRWRTDGSTAILIRDRLLHATDVRSVWYRRPGHPFGDRTMQDSPNEVLNAQWRAFVDGALFDLPQVTWVNHPVQNSRAESKIRQLRVARERGFSVPETIVTNSVEEATRAAAQWSDGAVIKALDSPLIVIKGEERFVFTSRLTASHLKDTGAFATAPVIVQQRIEPRRDIRVTVVGDRVFSAATLGVTQQDWRLEKRRVRFERVRIPRQISAQCVDLVAVLGLRFGAIDLALAKGRYHFLEINPNGEWGWLQALGLPIASSIARTLLGAN